MLVPGVPMKLVFSMDATKPILTSTTLSNWSVMDLIMAKITVSYVTLGLLLGVNLVTSDFIALPPLLVVLILLHSMVLLVLMILPQVPQTVTGEGSSAQE